MKHKCIKLGNYSYYKRGTVKMYFDPVIEVGNYSSIAKYVCFMGKVHHAYFKDRNLVSVFPFKEHLKWDFPSGEYSRGKILIGNDCLIGMEAMVFDGVKIGDGAVVGARAVVAKDIPPYAVVVGNPCKVVKYRYPEDNIYDLLRIKWWNWPVEVVKDRLEDFKDINKFIAKYKV